MLGPPTSFMILFYLVFGLIAIAVVTQMFLGFRHMRRLHRDARSAIVDRLDHTALDPPERPAPAQSSGSRNYDCDHCGARVESGGDISPAGEFKCRFCGKWSSIHE